MDNSLKDNINKTFGNQIRVRVCGICVEGNSVLLVRHEGIGDKGYMWAPPGGGIQFNERIPETLEREFKEETGLDVTTGEFLFANEFFQSPLHALELFFRVYPKGGNLYTGYDPEMDGNKQIISDVGYIAFEDIKRQDAGIFHNVMQKADNASGLLKLKGFFQNIYK